MSGKTDAASAADSTTRRRYLGALGAGVAATIAGCTVPFLDDSSSSVGGSGPVPPLVTNWVPAVDRRLELAGYTDHVEVDSVRDSLPDTVGNRAGVSPSTNEEFGFDESLGLYYRRQSGEWANCRLKTGSIDTERIESVLDDVGYDSSEERGEFTIYRGVAADVPFVSNEPPYDFAVSAEHLVSAPPDFDPVDLSTFLDTYAGEANAATESDSGLGALLQVTGGSSFFDLGRYDSATESSLGSDASRRGDTPKSTQGYLRTYQVGEQRTELHLAFLYTDASAADEDEFDTFIRRDRTVAAYEDTSVSTSGRLGVVDGTIPTERFNYLRRKEPVADDSPISAYFEYPEEDTVLVMPNPDEHVSGPNKGEPVTDSYVVHVNGEERYSWESGEESDLPWTVSVERGDVVSITGGTPEGATGTVRYHV